MPKYTSPLDGVRVAAPCPADWGRMVGDERVRFCDRCSLHVYNLSGMSRREAEGLVAGTEGRLCVRYYQRADGTILTRNCPVGLNALKRRAARVAGSVLSAVLGFFAGLGLNFGLSPASESRHVMGTIAAAPSLMPVEGVNLPAPDPDMTVLGEANVREIRGRVMVGKIAPVKVTFPDDGDAARRPRHVRRGR